MRRWLAAHVALALATPAAAQDDKPAWVGVWEGTVGTLPVMACLDTWGGEGGGHGSYYYRSQLEPIALSEEEGEGGWVERTSGSDDTAEWNFTELSATAMRGNWRQLRRVLPFALHPVSWTEGDAVGPCGSDAFLQPRIAPGTVVREAAEREGWRYTRLVYRSAAHFADDASIESFRFSPEQPGDAAINDELAFYLPQDVVGDTFLQCSANTIASFGHDGNFYERVEPRMVSRRFLTVAVAYDMYCGGAHPATWTAYRSFDRQTGLTVDVYDWIGPRRFDDEDRPLSGALREVVLARFPTDRKEHEGAEECREAVAREEYWTLELTLEGISFTPNLPRVVMACGDEVLLTWQDLAPFLDAEGRAGLALLRAD